MKDLLIKMCKVLEQDPNFMGFTCDNNGVGLQIDTSTGNYQEISQKAITWDEFMQMEGIKEILESNVNHSLPARDRLDSIVRYIAADYLGTDVKPGQQVLLISCQLDASYVS